ncbi:hypothetical protein RGUI_3411 [Rhodovulum sp. P5]|uniref:hypothetical protein n=1 Tax=Rhodovulum sp. P5 TaxID=1564506 RepID=UPI0009C28B6C|nr:hypothetical protein [Rhodovulum sp. P5]ARE41552.1 hypothetical protein RGUI_3411 [Rhodovulum sp. P5]
MAHADATTEQYSQDFAQAGLMARVMRMLRKIAEENPHLRRARSLQAMNDAQLRRLGIARGKIVHHAFRDVYYR